MEQIYWNVLCMRGERLNKIKRRDQAVVRAQRGWNIIYLSIGWSLHHGEGREREREAAGAPHSFSVAWGPLIGLNLRALFPSLSYSFFLLRLVLCAQPHVCRSAPFALAVAFGCFCCSLCAARPRGLDLLSFSLVWQRAFLALPRPPSLCYTWALLFSSLFGKSMLIFCFAPPSCNHSSPRSFSVVIFFLFSSFAVPRCSLADWYPAHAAALVQGTHARQSTRVQTAAWAFERGRWEGSGRLWANSKSWRARCAGSSSFVPLRDFTSGSADNNSRWCRPSAHTNTLAAARCSQIIFWYVLSHQCKKNASCMTRYA